MTVVARTASIADVAATLIANAVNIESKKIEREPASELDPDSDLFSDQYYSKAYVRHLFKAE